MASFQKLGAYSAHSKLHSTGNLQGVAVTVIITSVE